MTKRLLTWLEIATAEFPYLPYVDFFLLGCGFFFFGSQIAWCFGCWVLLKRQRIGSPGKVERDGLNVSYLYMITIDDMNETRNRGFILFKQLSSSFSCRLRRLFMTLAIMVNDSETFNEYVIILPRSNSKTFL